MLKPLALVLSGSGVFALSTAIVAAPQFERPGPTQAHVWIENRTATEAIPVILHEGGNRRTPMPVLVAGVPSVTMAPGTVVQARLVRQGWEYRTTTVQPDQNLAGVLSNLGADGWELITMMPAPASGTTVVMKRPR